ncbi:Nramp family divalent metal transporter [Alicyclobacillus fastidiosus]|uniref:Nramp family divalent metal transporter n=1 Tax=Alicyclobacillus fastidiosus TaxID=392011 RepID=A0ABY6ZJY2_9BACL|nr:Nramp family divalent metal transporter [Alicyclobacillus fastidiosus]WAH43243.1 Nramp family divalent metal transporter [Alicyclobacillus fastidiosus]GMA65284.1 putative manganese transport transmembrane protein [Alicyclobacillus fastidiosus]
MGVAMEKKAQHSAVLDSAHVGDIKGALGTVRLDDNAPRKSWWARIRTLLAIMGPGLIVMVGDNDAGGVSTYAQAGQNYGTSLLWVLLLLIPVLMVCQEMVVRLGLVTGVGHARLIFQRFGKFWGAFSVGDLFILNFLTIVTEFIGISMAMTYFGVSEYISVPVAALLLILITVTGSFRRWESSMFVCIVLNFLVIPLAFMSHPHFGPMVRNTFVPSVQGGLNSNALLLIIGLVGTTVAPWQLFFQQSNVIDKRLTPRWMKYERADTFIGAFVVIIGAAAIIAATAFAFQGTKAFGNFVDSATVANLFAHHVSRVAGNVFAIVLLNASIIGAGAVTLSTSYAFGDVFGINHSLHRSFKDAKGFYIIYAAIVLVAAGIVLIPNAPLGLMTILVQALAGVLLPSATVFLLILCNDKAVLGPWVNKPWQNVLGAIIVGVLTMLSLILAATTLFPNWNVTVLTEILAGVLIVSLLVTGVFQVLRRGKAAERDSVEDLDRWTWRMLPLDDLPKAMPSRGTAIGMLSLRAYLVIAVVLLVVKAIQLALGHTV